MQTGGPEPLVPGLSSTPPQGHIWDMIRSLQGAVSSYPARLKEQLQGMGSQFLHDPTSLVEGIVGPGELGAGGAEGAARLLLQHGKDGATLHPRTLAPTHESGYAVADPSLTKTFAPGEDQVASLTSWLRQPEVAKAIVAGKHHFGVWTNPANGQLEVNLTNLYPKLEDAQRIGIARGQHSVGHIGEGGEYKGDIALPQLRKDAVPELAQIVGEKFGGTVPTELPALDPARSKKMAAAYEALPVNDPAAKKGYDPFNKKIAQQKAAFEKAGYRFEMVDHDPYKSSQEMIQDVRENKRLKVLKTNAESAHPYMTPEQNDNFRGVHDLMHAASGMPFGPRGEEALAQFHASTMGHPLAARALLTETRGQNSWVNFGPHSHLPVGERPFAPQKAALWPEEFSGPAGQMGPQTSLPKNELTPTAWALAHHTAGTSSQDEWMANIQRDNKPLADRLAQTPDLAEKLYGAAKRQQKFAESLTSPEKAQKDFAAQQGASPTSASWYAGWSPAMKEALGPELASAFTNVASHLSARESPERETEIALKALELHAQGRPINTSSLRTTQIKVDKVNAALQGVSTITRKQGIPEQKTADYNLARRGLEGRSPLDRHMVNYYLGKESLGIGGNPRGKNADPGEINLSGQQREVLQGRMESDARKAGVSVPQFQAAIWGHQTGYPTGFGEAGAPAEDWVRYHLATKPDEFASILSKYPGLVKLRNEGILKGIEKEKGR
jgi:hypothetical protein